MCTFIMKSSRDTPVVFQKETFFGLMYTNTMLIRIILPRRGQCVRTVRISVGDDFLGIMLIRFYEICASTSTSFLHDLIPKKSSLSSRPVSSSGTKRF